MKPTEQGMAKRRRYYRGVPAVAGVGALTVLLAACGGSSTTSTPQASGGGTSQSSGGPNGLYGSLPSATGAAASGGTITIGQLKGSTPLYAMPITPAATASVYGTYDFIDLMNQPVYWGPKGATPEINYPLSLANPPVYSNGDKTVAITFKKWNFSNGSPVTAADALLFIDVLKQAVAESAANFSNYTPGYFPDNVASATASGQTLTMNLTKPYNPGYFTDDQLGLMYAFPPQWAVTSTGGTPMTQQQWSQPSNAKAIYDYLNKQASSLSTFGSDPLWQISDGPMTLKSFNAASGEYTMAPNPSYGGPVHAKFGLLDAQVFTTTQAQFNELIAGNLDMGGVDYSDLPQVGRLKSSYSVFGLPDFGWEGMIPNFEDTTGNWNNIINQLYVRQAMAHLVDQPGYIRGIFKNAGGPSYSTVPALPSNPYTPSDATSAPYPYSVSTASKLLSSHGWKVAPNGQTTCVKAGSGPGECGSGIPAGTPLAFNLQYGNTPPAIGQQVIAFASAAKEVGIQITLQQETFNTLISNDTDPSAPSKKNTWAMEDFGGFTNSTYPTSNTLFNTGGSFNLGGFNSPELNNLINASVYGGNPTAVKAEASYIAKNLPVFFQPNPDLIVAVSKKIVGPADGFLNMTQYTWTPQYWSLAK